MGIDFQKYKTNSIKVKQSSIKPHRGLTPSNVYFLQQIGLLVKPQWKIY